MLRVCDLVENATIQCEFRCCYYDEVENERIIADYNEVSDKEVHYIYCEDDILYIEVDLDE